MKFVLEIETNNPRFTYLNSPNAIRAMLAVMIRTAGDEVFADWQGPRDVTDPNSGVVIGYWSLVMGETDPRKWEGTNSVG